MMARLRLTVVPLTVLSLLLSIIAPPAAAAGTSQHALAPSAPPAVPIAGSAAPVSTNWCVAGDFNGWNNNDPSTLLHDDGTLGDLVALDGVWSRDITVASSGHSEFKVVECNNWGNAKPPQNAWFNTAAAGQAVKITLDANNHAGDAGLALYPAANIVNAYDTFVTTLSAAGDFNGWNNNDPSMALADFGNGFYRLSATIAAAGAHSGKIVVSGSWDAYTSDGRQNGSGSTLDFTTSVPNQTVVFVVDQYTGRATIAPNGANSGNWCVAGAMNGWNNASDPLNDNGTNGDLAGGDGMYSLDFSVASAGYYEFKIVECGNWGVAYPAANSWFNTAGSPQTVKFTFDANDHSADAGLVWSPRANIVNVWDALSSPLNAVGSFNGWNNNDPATALADLGGGIWGVTYNSPLGNQTGRLLWNHDWARNFGTDGRTIGDTTNFSFQVFHAGDPVFYGLQPRTGRVAIAPPPSGSAGHDGVIFVDQLGHNSRSTQYRVPGGPVTTGTAVTLRMSAASNDLTGARVRVYNTRTHTEAYFNMTRVADDGTHEWWEALVPGSSDTTVYWYRFIAMDTPAVAYYEDDAARDGGWGAGYTTSPDYGWQLTVYDPSYYTPDWMKNAVVYQIFPDRFRDANPANDTPAGSFFYNEAGGTVVRSLQSNWNQYICDPRDPGSPCAGTYSKNFYGGDLAGVTAKLDYLQSIGVTALYFNPIFESPSNHKYDTTDYGQVDDNFGTLAEFQALMTAAHARGMHVILDGVFNHTSSDSVYFDRYGRYATTGACESTTSPYRDWYFFQLQANGPCAGPATYTSWFGYDSLPKLNSLNQQVRDLIWAQGTTSIGPYWLDRAGFSGADGWRLDVAGDVDPGLNDPSNNYWEGFRSAVRATDPQAMIIGEEWGNASNWLLGQEWDATMNYQYSSAMLSFWRDTTYTDNDHNSGSSAGPLAPLTPTQLDNRLHNWQERYPAQAYYAELNLLGSHDTARALTMLNHGPNTPGALYDPNYDWSDAIARLKGVTVLQFTLPGAPTVYYGDEVGLVGPPAVGSVWEDDPYNRQPYPWLDESGTPFYAFLQTEAGQSVLRSHYTLLATTRNAHPALRTGDFTTLLVDDSANVYAYGRKMADNSDAAIVMINRALGAQDVTVDVTAYLPNGATFSDVLNGGSYSVTGGHVTVPAIPGHFAALLVLTGIIPAPPAPPTALAVVAEHNAALDLAWTGSGADSYNVYRSFVSGGGYALVGNTTGTTFSDTGLNNAVTYYYVVTGRNDTTLLESAYSNEASGIPHHDIAAGWADLQWPYEITHTISTITPTVSIYGQLWLDGWTGGPSPAAGISAEAGYGPSGSTPDPTNWIWFPMHYDSPQGNNDQYVGTMLPDQLGNFDFTVRWSADGGRTWFYADRDDQYYTPGRGGLLHVIPSSDLTPPAAPIGLALVATAPGSISMQWTANGEPDLAGYEIFREDVSAPGFARIDTVGSAATSYEDTSVTSGHTYNYYIKAFDTSFNRSAASNTITATAEYRYVHVTFRANIPDWTPASTIYIAGDNAAVFGASWDPGHQPLTQISATVWEYSVDVLDGTALQYKYTRGSWNAVEWWGAIIGTNNRSATIAYGTTGTQLIDDTVVNWRDLLPVAHTPAAAPTSVLSFTVTFNRLIDPATVNFNNFTVTAQSQVITGTWTQIEVPNPVTDPITATQFIFTPNVVQPDPGFYVITIAPGMLGIGNDGVGLLNTVYIFVGTPTDVNVSEMRAGVLHPQAFALPAALLVLLAALVVRRRYFARR